VCLSELLHLTAALKRLYGVDATPLHVALLLLLRAACTPPLLAQPQTASTGEAKEGGALWDAAVADGAAIAAESHASLEPHASPEAHNLPEAHALSAAHAPPESHASLESHAFPEAHALSAAHASPESNAFPGAHVSKEAEREPWQGADWDTVLGCTFFEVLRSVRAVLDTGSDLPSLHSLALAAVEVAEQHYTSYGGGEHGVGAVEDILLGKQHVT